MSVIGFDIGNESCVIATAKRGGIDVLLNEEGKCETPSVVSFGDKQRFLGSAGAAFATSYPKSTISQIKRLIGRLYKEPSVQEDLKLLPFATSEAPRGGILVELEYLNKKWAFTPVEILGMLFTHLKQIAEKNLESPVVDCVIGIPAYFTDLQRREYLDAARIAGLRPLRLIHDGTAIALGYGIYKTDLSGSEPTNVIFVDIGHCDTQVTVAAFKQGEMKILSHSFDPNLGGRDFDEVLFNHFAAQFKEKYKINVYSNPRASIRLRASCEKVKKVLSANAEAPISIECLIDDTDVRGVIKREEFEKLSHNLLERVTDSCIKAVEDSSISVDKIYTIELVGSGSRIPAIMRMLTFNKEPTRTLNASECVARGCALLCEMISSSLTVRDYKVEDIFPYSIVIPLDKVKKEAHQQVMLFQKGSAFPKYKMVKNRNIGSRYFQVLYNESKDFPAGVSPKVGSFRIGSSETSDSEKQKVEFTMKLNDHGIVEIKSASIVEDKHSDSAPRTFQYYVNNIVGTTSNLEFSKNLDVATTEDELLEAHEREQMLSEQDKKSTLESFVDDTRSKLSSAYRKFDTDSENKVITVSVNGNMETTMMNLNKTIMENSEISKSLTGFDIGNENCVVAVLNGESKHEIPTVVSFGEKQRFFGSAAVACAIINSKSTISQVKRLIGRQYKEPSVQEDLRLLPFETSEARHGGVLIHIENLNRILTFTPVQILGMVFAHLKQMTEKNLESPLVDCVIGIPVYFTYLQRCEYLDAACIAGLRPLSLMHDCTAVALYYANYKLSQPMSKPTNVMFVDIGHCDTQVMVVAFEQGQMKILSHSFDQDLGGRDFDEVLFRHFAAQFKKQHNMDIYTNTRASLRLRASCEKLKKELSGNAEAAISINRLMDDEDLEGSISREEFENLSSELLERVTFPCVKAVEDSGLTVDKIYTIELVGSGSRVPAIMRKLGSHFQKEPMLMLDGSECVARGCARFSAILSPTLQDRDYEVQDSLPYTIGICSEETPPISVLFERGCPFPSFKEVTFHRSATFYLDVYFTHESEFPAEISPVGYFMIGPFETSSAAKAEVKVIFHVNRNGIIKIESALMLEDEQSSSNNGDTTRKNLRFYENLYVKTVKNDIREALEIQHKLAEQDKKAEQKLEKRNILEAFVYDTRRKLRGSNIESEERILRILQETEDWLYDNDSDDESEQDYAGKLQDLKKLIEPAEKKYKDEKAKAEATKSLLTLIKEYRVVADTLPTKFDEEVKYQCIEVEKWLNKNSPKNFDSIGWSNFIKHAIEVFKGNCEYAMEFKPSSSKHNELVD